MTSFLRGPAALVLRLSCRDEIADDQNGFAATHERSTGPQRVRLARLRGTWTVKDLVSESGAFWISLTYEAPTCTGKTSAHTDTYHGRFVKPVTNEQVVEVVEFETTAPRCKAR